MSVAEQDSKGAGPQHTPGPWRARGPLVLAAARAVALAQGLPQPAKHYPETLANARLIAAAPALLEACEALLDGADCSDYGEIDDGLCARAVTHMAGATCPVCMGRAAVALARTVPS